MLGLVINVLWFLVFLCIIVGIGWLIIWVLGQLGIPVPPMVVKIGLLIIGLLCLIWFLTMLVGGGGMMPMLR
jgi:hypothetical protein